MVGKKSFQWLEILPMVGKTKKPFFYFTIEQGLGRINNVVRELNEFAHEEK